MVTLLSLLLSLQAAESSAEGSAGPDESVRNVRSLKLLWIGSSSTAMLMDTATKAMNSAGDLAVTSRRLDKYFRLDYVLKDRLNPGARKPSKRRGTVEHVVKAVNEERYDYVVVQVIGSVVKPKYVEHVPGILDEICQAIKESGATPLVFEHWSDEPEVMRRLCMEAARRHGGRVALCGSSVERLLQEKDRTYLLNRLTGDMHHAGPNGIYLWACAFYAALSGKSPESLKTTHVLAKRLIDPTARDPRGGNLLRNNTTSYSHEIPMADRQYMQRIVWEVYLNSKKEK